MADHTAIEWTDATWNPITGCSVASPGCTNCYAMRLAGTRLRHHPSRVGLTSDSKAGPVWNGEVRLNEGWLTQPLQWTRPRMIFVCAHGDLFHESVPDAWIDRVFAVMALAPQHTFQVLTKRSGRMRDYIGKRAGSYILDLSHAINAAKLEAWADHPNRKVTPRWPLSNVWLGVSAEDQRRADERVPDLLATPAAVRFVSAEPLLGPIKFDQIRRHRQGGVDLWNALTGFHGHCGGGSYGNSRLDWIIVGGESGPGARAMHPAWARSIRDQCAAVVVAFHFKQWGAWGELEQSPAADEAGWQGRSDWMILDRDGGLDIPDDRWPDEEAGEVAVVRVGKKAAGRLLDGVEHKGMPKVRA